MKITTRGQYAVKALIDLRNRGVVVTLSELAAANNLPIDYLEQLFRRLKLKGIVASVRGPGGGYYIGRPYENITLKDILESVGEKTSVGEGNTWSFLNNLVNNALTITLKEMV